MTRFLYPKALFAIFAIFLAVSSGCNREANPSGQTSKAPQENGSQPETENADDNSAFAPALNVGQPRDPSQRPSLGLPESLGGQSGSEQSGAGQSGAGQIVAQLGSGLQVPTTTDPEQLATFFAETDREIQRLATTKVPPDQQRQLVEEIKRVAKLKQEAAERMLAVPQLDRKLTELAVSARMQAFSHRAAFGDVIAAEELEQYAKEMVTSVSPDISRDSRTILIAFALERLQGGVTTEPGEVLALIANLARTPETLNVASAKVMQRAMMILNQYGYREAAESVRGTIEQTFANTADRELATVVAEILASARFNTLEAMRAEMVRGTSYTADQWEQAAGELATAYTDAPTVQYLATLALQFESLGQIPAAEAFYQAMRASFVDANSENTNDNEVLIMANEAIKGYATRKSMLGQPFPIANQPTLAGKTINPSDFSGKIVLMPFWALEYSDSLAPLGGLESIMAAYPDKICMLGVNMDSTPAGQQQATQISTDQMPWPSIAAVNDSPGSNPFQSTIATTFGVVSLPVVIVLDPQHNVASIALSPEMVEAAVNSLLQQ